MVTLGVALILMELGNKLDWLTGGADGLQGVVMGPLLGRFESGGLSAAPALTALLDELQALIAVEAPAAVWPVQQASTSVIA
jgi:ABC-type branched-subunit amino acid transport system permease subunit